MVALVGLIGVTFTAAWTQWRADVRAKVERASNLSLDEKRRQDERDLRDLEHRRGVEERWRDERRAAHARLLALIREVNDDAFTYVMVESEDLSDDAEPRRRDKLLPEPHRTELFEALGVVQLIASDAAVTAATKVVDSLDWVESMASTPWGTMKFIRKHWRDYEEALVAYRRDARRELGVATTRQPRLDDGSTAPSS